MISLFSGLPLDCPTCTTAVAIFQSECPLNTKDGPSQFLKSISLSSFPRQSRGNICPKTPARVIALSSHVVWYAFTGSTKRIMTLALKRSSRVATRGFIRLPWGEVGEPYLHMNLVTVGGGAVGGSYSMSDTWSIYMAFASLLRASIYL